MREGTCNTKYYITYDGARKNDAPMSTDYSRYNLLNLEIKNGEYAYVEVIYKDINGQFLGLQKGKLEEIKSKTVVKAINTEKKVEIIFEFDSKIISTFFSVFIAFTTVFDLISSNFPFWRPKN